MEPSDEVCLCFHVSRRKIENFIRRERPQRPSQLSECHGAGTGCGWCRPFLAKLLAQVCEGQQQDAWLPSADDYARQRAKYVRAGKGVPPASATPLPPQPE